MKGSFQNLCLVAVFHFCISTFKARETLSHRWEGRMKRAREKYPDSDLAPGAGLEITPNPDFARVTLQNLTNPWDLWALNATNPWVCPKIRRSKSINPKPPCKALSPKKSYVNAVPCLVCCCLSLEATTSPPGFFFPNKSLELILLCGVTFSSEQSPFVTI